MSLEMWGSRVPAHPGRIPLSHCRSHETTEQPGWALDLQDEGAGCAPWLQERLRSREKTPAQRHSKGKFPSQLLQGRAWVAPKECLPWAKGLCKSLDRSENPTVESPVQKLSFSKAPSLMADFNLGLRAAGGIISHEGWQLI